MYLTYLFIKINFENPGKFLKNLLTNLDYTYNHISDMVVIIFHQSLDSHIILWHNKTICEISK